jgi:ribose transport system ATP-binding protein
MRAISKSSAGTQVHALMRENGAGKSALIKILSGALRADPGGETRLADLSVVIDGPHRVFSLGMAIVHQVLTRSQNLSVIETLFFSRELLRTRLIARRAMRSRCGDRRRRA